jgi:hypothetical protein
MEPAVVVIRNASGCRAYEWMAHSASAAHLVRVLTDDLEYEIWVTATGRDEAVSRVLECVPEGWSASLLEESLSPNDVAVLKLQPGDVRKLRE